MYVYKIKIANKIVKVDSMYESTKRFCKNYITDDSASEDFSIIMTSELVSAELEKQSYEDRKDADILTDTYLEILALYRAIAEHIVDDGIILFHGSAVAVDGEAYIFTALSGTGKSTHTRLWREYFGDRAVMVNDDKPLISFVEDKAFVHGTPWNGKHNIDTNISLPIKSICILERDENNHIERVPQRNAFPTLYQQTYRSRNPEKLLKTLSIVDRMSKSVPIYRLGCNMNIEAARVAYEGMQDK